MTRGGRRGSTVAEPRWLVMPAWFWYLVFFLVPLGYMVVYAFAINSKTEFFTVEFGFNLDQFQRVWDPIYLRIYRDTLVMALTGTIGCLVIGLPLAYFIAMKARKNRTLLLFLVIVPFWTSLLIRTYAWVLILNEQGPLSSLLESAGLIAQPLNILYSPTAVWIGIVYDYLPLMVFPLYVAFERIDRGLLEASRDLGENRVRTFFRVTLPLAMPGVLTGCLLTFIPMTGEYVVPTILGGAKSYLVGSLIANEILTAIDWPFGAALSMVLIVVLLLLIGLYLRTLGKRSEENLGAVL